MVLKNPKRTGGPKTSEGKLISSRNSLKTGSYSGLSVLPNESPEEFNELVQQFFHDFQPRDVIETGMVRELAVIAWKKLRLEKLEQSYFIKRINSPIRIEELIECGLDFNEARYDSWINRKVLSDDDVKGLVGLIELIRPIIRMPLNVEMLIEFKSTYQPLYRALEDAYRQLEPLAPAVISDLDIVNRTVHLPGQSERYLSSVVMENLVTDFEVSIWCANHNEEIADAVNQIKQERLLLLMQSEGVRRSGDDLSRAMIRTLNELRKHSSWRLQHRVIDASEE